MEILTIGFLLAIVVLLISVIPTFMRHSIRTLGHGLLSELLNLIHYTYRQSPVFHAVGRILTDRKCPKGVPALDVCEKVSDRCYRVLGLNPGSHTLQGTNTWLVGSGPVKILVDTGEDISADAYVSMLFNKAFPASGTQSLSHILLTHGHGTFIPAPFTTVHLSLWANVINV